MIEGKKILVIDAGLRGEESRTRRLCRKWMEICAPKEKNEVEWVTLTDLGLRPLDKETLDKRTALIAAGDFSDPMFDLAKQFRAADHILICAPYYDLSFPSILKVYVEHIMVDGLLFYYEDERCRGLCRAKDMVYFTTAGGYIKERNFGYTYMAAVCRMVGIHSMEEFSAEGLDLGEEDPESIMDWTLIQIGQRLE